MPSRGELDESSLEKITAYMVRLDVGGKLLTNKLKELVSYRQWNMMDETYIMNHAKETCCYVSTRFFEDLETCR
jgi:actin-related protein 6